jgi:hypothetical protein
MKHKNTNTHLGLQRAIPNPIADVHGSWQNEVFDQGTKSIWGGTSWPLLVSTFEATKLVIRTIGFLSNRNSLLDKSATSKSRTPGRFEWMIEGTAVNNNWVGSCRRAWSVSMFRIQPCYTRISKVVKRHIVWISTPVLVGRSSWENGSGKSLDKAFGSTSSRINRAILLNSDHRFIRQQ